MSKSDTIAQLYKIMSLVLERELTIDEQINMQTEPAWDSIRHIELIITLEQELELAFAPEIIPSLTSSGALLAEIIKLRAACPGIVE